MCIRDSRGRGQFGERGSNKGFSLGNIIIRGVFGEPETARLISLKIKPHPAEGYENIAPHLNVIFAAGLSIDYWSKHDFMWHSS